MSFESRGIRMGMTEDRTAHAGIRWFGRSWHAPVCVPARRMSTPVGWLCLHCLMPINPEHRGIAIGLAFPSGSSEAYEHLSCFLADLGVSEVDVHE